MSDVVTSAKAARERLAQGLGALQGPGVPEHLIAVAEPIAQAMGCLHRIESTGGQVVLEAGPQALAAVRSALGLLQAQTVNHPSVEAALEAVAGSLGLVHALVRITSSAPPPQPQPAAPQPAIPAAPAAAAVAFAATAVAPAGGFGLTAPIAPPVAAQASAQVAAQVQAAPLQPTAVAVTKASAGAGGFAAPSVGSPDSAFTPNSTLQSQGAERPPYGASGGSPYVAGDTQPEAKPLVQSSPPAKGQLRIEAALGAHSHTNFYKGLSGNDVVDAGGIFVATYQIPRIGTPLVLKVSLPGGYEFEAQAVVRWTRDSSSVSDGGSPGFGAQFTSISSEGRQLVYRYVRNREPLFHDDL